MILFVPFFSFALSFSLLGCYKEDTGIVLDTPFMQKGTVNSLKGCINACLSHNIATPIVAASLSGFPEQNNYCKCLPAAYQQAVNLTECNLICTDGFPCGGSFKRSSLYTINQEDLTLKYDGMAFITRNARLYTALAVVVALKVLLFFALACLGLFLYLRYRKRTNNSNYWNKPSEGSGTTFVIPHLPRTKDLIYSAERSYTPVNADELAVSIGNTVAVKKVFQDEWCDAINISTGFNGVLSLSCLVPAKEGMVINMKARNQSLPQVSASESERESKEVPLK